MDEREAFAAVGELTAVDAGHRDAGIPAGEGFGVAHQHREAAGREPGAGREGEAHAVGEAHAAEVQLGGAHVLQLDELEVVAVHIAGRGRMVHQLGDRQRVVVADEGERGLGERAPVGVAEHARTEGRGLGDREIGRVQLGRRRDGIAQQTRVRTIGRVIDRAGGRADRDLESGRHVASVLAERGCGDGGIQLPRLELVEHRRGALAHVVVEDAVHLGQPVPVARQRDGHLGIAPARRLRDHGGVDLVGARPETGAGGGRRERAAVFNRKFAFDGCIDLGRCAAQQPADEGAYKYPSQRRPKHALWLTRFFKTPPRTATPEPACANTRQQPPSRPGMAAGPYRDRKVQPAFAQE